MDIFTIMNYLDKLNDNLCDQIDVMIKLKNLPVRVLLTNFSHNPDGPGRIDLRCKNKTNDDIKVSVYIMSTHALLNPADYFKLDIRAGIRTKAKTMDPAKLATVRVLRIVYDTAQYYMNHYFDGDGATINIGLDGTASTGWVQ